MSQLVLEDMDDSLLAALQEKARREGLPVAGAAVKVLREALHTNGVDKDHLARRRALAGKFRDAQALTAPGPHPPAEDVLRELREAR